MAKPSKNAQATKATRRRSRTLDSIELPSIRRRNSTEQRERKAKTNATSSSQPPVMARGYRMDVPFQGNASYTRKGRRRIDLPLKVPGAEMRLPAMPTWRAISRWLWFGILAGLVGLVYFLWSAPFFRVEAASVQGVERVHASDINTVLGVSGKSILGLRPAKLENELQTAFPEFSSVDVEVKLPNKLLVKVVERVPVLTWHQGDTHHLIDQEGYSFPQRLAAETVITPVIEAAGSPPGQAVGINEDAAAVVAASAALADKDGQQTDPHISRIEPTATEPFLKSEMVSAILAVSEALPPTVTIIFDPEHGLGWKDEGGWQVYLGDDRDIEIKLKVYAAIVQRLTDEAVQPSLISVEHVHNPYFRVEPTN